MRRAVATLAIANLASYGERDSSPAQWGAHSPRVSTSDGKPPRPAGPGRSQPSGSGPPAAESPEVAS